MTSRSIIAPSILSADFSKLGEGGEIGIGRCDHQMAVEDLVRAVADRLDNWRAEGDVRHEMAVHHVEMDPVRAGAHDRLDLVA